MAVIVIAIIAALNVNVMFGDSAEKSFVTFSLSEELALGEITGNSKQGPTQTTRVHCVVQTSSTTTTYNNNSNSSGWNANGNVSAGWGPVNGSVSGGYNSNNSNGSSNSTTTTTNTTKEYWANKIMCQHASGECTPFDPC